MVHAPWWKGTRGEWYVVAQVALAGLVFLGPRTLAGRPEASFPLPGVATIAGIALLAAGVALALSGALKLGGSLAAVPRPKDGAALVETGPYRIVRHPMYSGGILVAFGWALLSHGWLTLAYAALLGAFFDVKSRREERWLVARYPDYRQFQRRVRRLVPFLY